MNKLLAFVILLGIGFSSLAQPSIQAFSPQTFKDLPNVRDLAISPDGNEMYFSVQSVRQDFTAIMVSHKTKKDWELAEHFHTSLPAINHIRRKFKLAKMIMEKKNQSNNTILQIL